ncbi:MAG TPA: zinc ribbon domain-containing protein [Blastocatellia bacterium]|nr:zinc ribbon domain-containing protein [Blastocatellia bacterium]
MFCPACGLQVNDDLKFCKQCGANLRGVRKAMTSNSAEGKSDWNNTRWAEIAHAHAMKELGIGLSPEEKRINEIKAGVITSAVGIGVTIFLYLFFDVVTKGKSDPFTEILRNLWMVGIIPFLVGISIIFNGLFISRWLVKLKGQQSQPAMPASQAPVALPAKTTDQLVANTAQAAGHSVTEEPTLHFTEPVAAPTRRETG